MFSLKISEHLKRGIKKDASLQPLSYDFLPAAKGLNFKTYLIFCQLCFRIQPRTKSSAKVTTAEPAITALDFSWFCFGGEWSFSRLSQNENEHVTLTVSGGEAVDGLFGLKTALFEQGDQSETFESFFFILRHNSKNLEFGRSFK